MDSVKHPIHFVSKEGKMSPSAFIPFCEFGGNISGMGVKINQFHVPVCNSFKAKILNDQLCYEVDLNILSDKDNIHNELELGFYFIMDYNKERQVNIKTNFSEKKGTTMAKNILDLDRNQEAFIYLNSIGWLNS